MSLFKHHASQSGISHSKILSGYVKKNAFFAISLAILGLWLLQVVFSYLGELDSLSETYTTSDALLYILYKSPYFLSQFIPTGALLGAVVGLGLLANHSELVVMRAGGISNVKIVSWVMQPALLFVLLALSINQFVLPTTNYLADSIGEKERTREAVISVEGYWTTQPITTKNAAPAKADTSLSGSNDGVNNDSGKEIIYIDYADTNGNITGVKRWQLDATGTLMGTSMAVSGHYQGKQVTDDMISYQWQLQEVRSVQISPSMGSQSSYLATDTISLPIEPQSVYLLTKEAEDLSLTQLYDHKQFMHSQNNRSLAHELAFWQKLLSPFAILSLVIVACSFVFGSLRTHSLGSRVVVALLFGLLFNYMQDLTGFVSIATGWSPLLMVILPIVACAMLGIYLLRRQS